MPACQETNLKLKQEADQLLWDHGLLEILGDYGRAHIVGSYALDLMVWRDLDVYVDAAGVTLSDIYRLVNRLCQAFEPVWLEFKDSRTETSGCPQGFFVGLETRVVSGRLWNIDIWFTDTDYIRDQLAFTEKIKCLPKEAKRHLLELKAKLYQHPDYGTRFFSVDIYQAVLEAAITDPNSFWVWLRQRQAKS